MPGTQATSDAADEAEQDRRRRGRRPATAALITWAATTAASPMMKPIERSMPPEMMTKVWPVASRSGATAKMAIDCRLNGLRMKVPPKAVRAQASKTTMRPARKSQARRSAMRWSSVLACSAWSACGAPAVG